LTRAAFIAASICLLAAGAEGLFAGPGVRARLAALRQPSLSPPFPVWVAIGIGYYVVCFTLLYRLLRVEQPRATHLVAFSCLGALLLVNALWNYFFFRRRDLRASLLLNIPYAVIVVALAMALVRLGDGSIWVFVPYLVYLIYAVYYQYATWRLNNGA
jgi:translocator protein